MALRAHGRAASEAKDASGMRLSSLAIAASGFAFLVVTMPLSAPHCSNAPVDPGEIGSGCASETGGLEL